MSQDAPCRWGSDSMEHKLFCEEKIGDCFTAAGFTHHGVRATCAPTVTRYYVYLTAPISNTDLDAVTEAIRMAVGSSARVYEAEGEPRLIIAEVENAERHPVLLADLRRLSHRRMYETMSSFNLGIDAEGRLVTEHLSHMPHLLVAGTAGSGKTNFFHLLIDQLASASPPDRVNFLLFATKLDAFARFADLPHLLRPVVRFYPEATATLDTLRSEMWSRLNALERIGVDHIYDYNKRALQRREFPPMPYTVVVIDEMLDLMLTEKSRAQNTELLCDLAQRGHDVGIHLVMGARSLSPLVLPPRLLHLVPSRLAFHLNNEIDSYFFIAFGGAECLRPGGDALLLTQYHEEALRLQVAQV